MIKDLWAKFSKKKTEPPPEQVAPLIDDEPVASITFNLEDDGVVWVAGHWDGEHQTALLLGEMLFHLNSGQMVELIQQQLIEQCELDEDLEFLEMVLGTWQGVAKENSFKTAPMVHPLKTFEASRIQ